MMHDVAICRHTYLYRGYLLDSPSCEGCPLPTLSCVRREIGQVEGLILAVNRITRQGRAVITSGTDHARVITSDDVKKLTAGVVYWGMGEIGSQYAKTPGCRPSSYTDLQTLHATEEEYFDYLGVAPTEKDPHPELALIEAAYLCCKEGKEMTAQQRKVWRLPPASDLQAWYPVVRIEFDPKSIPWRFVGTRIVLMCAVQCYDDDAPAMGAWILELATLKLHRRTLDAMTSLEAKLAQAETLPSMCPEL